MEINTRIIHDLAAESGFDLAGVTRPYPVPDFGRFEGWIERGLAGEMRYLTDHRAEIRGDPAKLLPGVRSVISVGLLYNGPEIYSTSLDDATLGWIARYAWGDDYHEVLRAKLQVLDAKLKKTGSFESRICVDTAPLLERSYAQAAGLGWIGKNTCLINQQVGSWFFLGELLTTLELESDSPTPDRCGTCSRCIAACPTAAIVPAPSGRFEIDSRLCISYFTIELRSGIPEEHRAEVGQNIFGCDICQDVCPWNRKAPRTKEAGFAPQQFAPPLEKMAALSEEEFRAVFRLTPVSRARYRGFLRNVAVAMGNSGLPVFRPALEKLAACGDEQIEEHALWALAQLP